MAGVRRFHPMARGSPSSGMQPGAVACAGSNSIVVTLSDVRSGLRVSMAFSRNASSRQTRKIGLDRWRGRPMDSKLRM